MKLPQPYPSCGEPISADDGDELCKELQRLLDERDATIALANSAIQEQSRQHDEMFAEITKLRATIAAQAGEIERLQQERDDAFADHVRVHKDKCDLLEALGEVSMAKALARLRSGASPDELTPRMIAAGAAVHRADDCQSDEAIAEAIWRAMNAVSASSAPANVGRPAPTRTRWQTYCDG